MFFVVWYLKIWMRKRYLIKIITLSAIDLPTTTIPVKNYFEPLWPLWTIMAVLYYSYVDPVENRAWRPLCNLSFSTVCIGIRTIKQCYTSYPYHHGRPPPPRGHLHVHHHTHSPSITTASLRSVPAALLRLRHRAIATNSAASGW